MITHNQSKCIRWLTTSFRLKRYVLLRMLYQYYPGSGKALLSELRVDMVWSQDSKVFLIQSNTAFVNYGGDFITRVNPRPPPILIYINDIANYSTKLCFRLFAQMAYMILNRLCIVRWLQSLIIISISLQERASKLHGTGRRVSCRCAWLVENQWGRSSPPGELQPSLYFCSSHLLLHVGQCFRSFWQALVTCRIWRSKIISSVPWCSSSIRDKQRSFFTCHEPN